MTTRQASREGLRSRHDGMRMSEAEYLALPEEKPYLEWVDGLVVQKAVPNRPHGIMALEIGLFLRDYAGRVGGQAAVEVRALLGRVGRRYRLPDVSYWGPDRPRGADTPPSLAVEILSPTDSVRGQREKCRQYRENGVPVCWLVDPENRTVEVFEGELDGKALATGDVLETAELPGFSLRLAELFAVLDR